MNRLLIVDGHAYAYRAFHAIRDLRSPEGQPKNAVYGFLKMLEKMRATVDPTHLIVVWDGGLSAERQALLPEYKAHRPEMPEDLRPQLDEIGSYLDAAGVAQFCGDGIEADDYIACLARRAAEKDWRVIIASSDKDFMQLVTERVGLLNPNDKTGKIWGRDEVRAKSGVEPGQIAGWLALMGDAVDNIPGVPGVGPKTAAVLLEQFGTVENLQVRTGEVKSERLRASLMMSAETVKRNLELVRLAEVPCELEPEKLAVRPPEVEKLRNLFRRWGFKGMLADLEARSVRQAELI
ncbi:MAG TPA: 5'-3' exonuclease H3TH domain-containing protein [Candidatus Sulfotelmatobacter sp.]|nr:5'-3' exonuclease H3TH domain-containing protein [Candidatus Sulfotelmatobacter sp.]